MKKIALALVLGLVASGCYYKVQKNAIFTLSGIVKNSMGNPQVIEADEGYSLCLKVSYEVLNQGTSRSNLVHEECQDIATDQNGRFSLTKAVLLSAEYDKSEKVKADEINIKNATIYLTRSRSTSNGLHTYVYPVVIDSVSLNKEGGTISATAALLK